MTFTPYSDALTLDRDKVRLNIKDTQLNEGPRPDNRNFSDGEILYALTEEGSVTAATAWLFEILESEWQSFSLSETDSQVRFDAKGTADGYGTLAQKWKKKALNTLGYATKAGSVQPDRIDGYS